MKKLLSIALCLTMLSGICTATTHAAEAASETKTVTVDKNSCVVTRKDTLLYSLPKGGLDYPYERHYYKKNDNKALFATYRCVNTYDSTGYDWYECVLVSADKDATLMYTTPTNWMPGYGKTESLEYRGENWYYTYGAAMHVAREDEPKNVFCLNDVTGVKLYKEMEDVVKDLIDFYMGADSETEIENDEEVKEDVVENTPSKDAEEDSKKEDTSKEEVVEDETSKDTVEVEDVVTDDKTSEDEEKDTTDEEDSKEEEKEAVADEETSKDEEKEAVADEDASKDDVQDNTADETEKDVETENNPEQETENNTNSGNAGILVLVNNIQINFDQAPIIENGRTLVPLRAIFEALGAEVLWDADTQTVTATKGILEISLQINSMLMYVNGFEIPIDVPATIVNNRTLVPVRAISESLGCKVDWIPDSKTVAISY